MTEKFNYLSLARITKLSLALYQKLISMGMHLILLSLVLVSKIAQFKSYTAGLVVVVVNGIRTHDLRDTGAMLYQLSYEATHWERAQFIEFISSRAVK